MALALGDSMAAAGGPEVTLRFGNARPMPVVVVGTAASTPVTHEATKSAVLAAIEVGFRHLDTAAMYGSEKPVGEAVAEAVRLGLLQSPEKVFVTSKLWCTQCHPNLVVLSLRESLEKLQMEYLDLYLIHWPVCMKPGPIVWRAKEEDAVPFDFEGLWRAMEECHRLGLAKAIGVSNFTTKHLDRVLAVATIPPAVNQVEMNPAWQQRTLRAYCADKGIHVAAYSPLGGQNWSRTGEGNGVLGSQVLAEIAERRDKTIAQGVTWIVKSYNKQRLKQNLKIVDWELTEDDRLKISQIPQKKYSLRPTDIDARESRLCHGHVFQASNQAGQREYVTATDLFSTEGEFTYVALEDIDIVEE